jgi:hypothetical protein
MKWPRRQWAVTRYYFGVSNGVVRRFWTEGAAQRAADAWNFAERMTAERYGRHEQNTYRVSRRGSW